MIRGSIKVEMERKVNPFLKKANEGQTTMMQRSEGSSIDKASLIERVEIQNPYIKQFGKKNF